MVCNDMDICQGCINNAKVNLHHGCTKSRAPAFWYMIPEHKSAAWQARQEFTIAQLGPASPTPNPGSATKPGGSAANGKLFGSLLKAGFKGVAAGLNAMNNGNNSGGGGGGDSGNGGGDWGTSTTSFTDTSSSGGGFWSPIDSAASNPIV